MRRAVNIFYQCVVGAVTILLALNLYGLSQRWHIRMMFAAISQGMAEAEGFSDDEKQKAKAKEDRLEADQHIPGSRTAKTFLFILLLG